MAFYALYQVHGFYGAIKPHTLHVSEGESLRVVDWLSDDVPYFNSKVTGLYPINGAFILKESGHYYIMISLLFQNDLIPG